MNKTKKIIAISLLCAVITGTTVFSGCSVQGDDTSSNIQPISISTVQQTESVVEFSIEDTSAEYDTDNAVSVKFNGSSADITGDGVSMDANTLHISAGGTYIISGTLDDGEIVISAGKDDTVRLVLDNVSINTSKPYAVYAEQCGKIILLLADGSANTIANSADNTDNTNDDSSPNAVIVCKDDLTILGNGSLTVNANANNGITSKDTLRISSGTVNVTAVHHGITGRDNLAIEGGTVNVTATSGDGLRSTYSDTDKDEKGHIFIENASVTVKSGNDAVQSAKNITINSGTFDFTTGDGAKEISSNNGNDMRGGFGFGGNNNVSDTDTESMKALKADGDIIINSGTFTINAYDDAIHGNSDVTITGGTLDIKSGDDGIHADNTLTIKNGTITISQSYEGLEGTVIDISGGTIDITATDDGINAAGGNDQSGFGNFDGGKGFGRFAGRQFNMQDNGTVSDNQSDRDNIPDISGMPDMDNMPVPPDMSGMPDMDNMPVPPNMSGMPDMDSMPVPPDMSGMPDMDSQSNTDNPSDNTDNDNSLSTSLNISGGIIYVNAQGDGVDSNSALNISGGTVVVNGTTQGGNGILDHDGTCLVTGGTIIGAGTYDMLEMPSADSSQKSVAVMFTSAQSAVHLYISPTVTVIFLTLYPPKKPLPVSCTVLPNSKMEKLTLYIQAVRQQVKIHMAIIPMPAFRAVHNIQHLPFLILSAMSMKMAILPIQVWEEI